MAVTKVPTPFLDVFLEEVGKETSEWRALCCRRGNAEVGHRFLDGHYVFFRKFSFTTKHIFCKKSKIVVTRLVINDRRTNEVGPPAVAIVPFIEHGVLRGVGSNHRLAGTEHS